MTEPLDWDALVRAAKRRRKQEGLTRQAHAALAGVSRDTLRAFDAGERTLTLEKALAILEVVGLTAGPGGNPEAARHAAFVRESWARWEDLVADRPNDDPTRLPHGRVTLSFRPTPLPQRLGGVDVRRIARAVESARADTGWSPWWGMTLAEPREERAAVEWVSLARGSGAASPGAPYNDAPHLGLLRAGADGDVFLLRGYAEDGRESGEPGAFLDLLSPILRLADFVSYAGRVVSELGGGEGGVILSAEWQGLTARRLVNWRYPTLGVPGSGAQPARSDTVRSSTPADIATIRADLHTVTAGLVLPLYAAFGLGDITPIVQEAFARR